VDARASEASACGHPWIWILAVEFKWQVLLLAFR